MLVTKLWLLTVGFSKIPLYLDRPFFSNGRSSLLSTCRIAIETTSPPHVASLVDRLKKAIDTPALKALPSRSCGSQGHKQQRESRIFLTRTHHLSSLPSQSSDHPILESESFNTSTIHATNN
ncbi:hypothetical protein VNO78_24957 [Psophocarpus tetragonolobus]|uniref:Uncharacterized protein n=1 Tax=Psophocarpus tetragonolobus TaxID=3891 RepID=A0AAN9S8P1_PSOTE